jgi:hypothetical protein
MGIVAAARLQRDADDVGDAVKREGMMPIPTRLVRKREGRRGTTTTTSLMSQVDEPHEDERAGLAVLKRRVPLLDDQWSIDSGRS